MRTKAIMVICFLLASAGTVIAQPGSDQQQAVFYYQAGDYEKAAVFYEKLYNKTQSDFYYNYYLKCLTELKSYKDAEKLIKKQQRKSPANLKYYVDLGEIFKLQGDEAKAKKEFENAIKELTGEENQVTTLAYAFRDNGELEYALKTYERGEKLSGNVKHYRMHKAEIYNLQGETAAMVNEYLLLLEDRYDNLEQVQNQLSMTISFEDPANPRIEILRTELLKRIQKSPDNEAYNELLIWYFQQKNDLNAAFNQVKALDKRKREGGVRMYQFGLSCKANDNYELAAKAFEYVVNEGGKNSDVYSPAKIELVEVLFNKIVTRGIYEQADLVTIEKTYTETLQELGKNNSTIALMRGLAKVQAFYLNKPQNAISLLTEASEMPGISAVTQAYCKMELADVLLLYGDIWEASLYYSQVEKMFKHDPIGHEAKFRNAKISFYTGDFAWAQAQLDVLKASTSKLISNDAMQLSLIITDNLGLDSLVEAMTFYAQADKFVYQHQFDKAIITLDSLDGKYPWHSLRDESHYLRYKIHMKKREYDLAAAELQAIIDNFGQDILADDAVFKLAELQHFYFKNEAKAAELYKKLFYDYPGSLYKVEAIKRYRNLIGETLN